MLRPLIALVGAGVLATACTTTGRVESNAAGGAALGALAGAGTLAELRESMLAHECAWKAADRSRCRPLVIHPLTLHWAPVPLCVLL